MKRLIVRCSAAPGAALASDMLGALLCAHAAAAATPAPKPIDLVHASATASSSASSILAQLSAEAAKIESDSEAGVCDVYGKGEWIEAFQEQVAADLGKEAGLFMPTGVCAQQAALSVYAGLPLASRSQLRPSFVTHATSHLLVHEENAYNDLLGLTALKAGDESRPLTAADVEVELKRLAAVGLTPCCIVIETPWRELGCRATPWDELLALRKLADKCVPRPALQTAPPCAGQAATRCAQAATPRSPGTGRRCTWMGRGCSRSRRGTAEIRPRSRRSSTRYAAPSCHGFGLGSGWVASPYPSREPYPLALRRCIFPSTRGSAG